VSGEGMKRNEYGILVGKPQGMRPFVRLGTGGRILLK